MEMGRLQFGSPRNAWGGEASAFTPLLSQADMLDYLGEETGIGPLTLVDVEHAVTGNRSLDILAETGDGRRVAIENQYGTANHDHLTRGLAYAVATEARALVVVAEGDRDEFVSVADYLNEVGSLSDTGIGVWLVKVRAMRRIGDTIWSPEFVIQTQPNDWEAEVRRQTSPYLASLDEFYDKCAADGGVDWADDARTVIEHWLNLGEAEGHLAQKSVALYCRIPGQQGRGNNVIQLSTDGTITVCRGYIWGSSLYDEATPPSDLDAEIRRLLPDARWPAKQFYIAAQRPGLAHMREISDWIVSRFRSPTTG